MADHIDPTGFLEDLQHVFAEGAGSGQGLTLDPQLCTLFVEGLGEVVGTVRALRTLAEDGGLLQRLTRPDPAPRSPGARRYLARTVTPLDEDRRIVAFPAAWERPTQLRLPPGGLPGLPAPATPQQEETAHGEG